MLYREIIAVCSQIHTKHTNTVCGQNVEFLNVKLVVHIVTTGLGRVKSQLQKPCILASQLEDLQISFNIFHTTFITEVVIGIFIL